jgi:hypothetical protein
VDFSDVFWGKKEIKCQKIWGPVKSFWLGSHSLFYADGQPEWTEFQARMQGVSDDGRAKDREAWATLGE